MFTASFLEFDLKGKLFERGSSSVSCSLSRSRDETLRLEQQTERDWRFSQSSRIVDDDLFKLSDSFGEIGDPCCDG